MDVKITDTKDNTITYKIDNLSDGEFNYLIENLKEGKIIKKENNSIIYTITFKPELYPFQSFDSQLKIEDYISREEIEMKYFLISFLEDM